MPKFDPERLLGIEEYDALGAAEQDAYDRAHAIHLVRERRGADYVRRQGLEDAPLPRVFAEYSNAVELGAASWEVARAWLIGKYEMAEFERNPEQYDGIPPMVG